MLSVGEFLDRLTFTDWVSKSWILWDYTQLHSGMLEWEL